MGGTASATATATIKVLLARQRGDSDTTTTTTDITFQTLVKAAWLLTLPCFIIADIIGVVDEHASHHHCNTAICVRNQGAEQDESTPISNTNLEVSMRDI